MSKRLIGVDAFSGIKTYHDYDHSSRKTVLIREHDNVEPVLDANKAQFNDGTMKAHGMKESFLKVASIPMIVIEKMRNEHGVDVFSDDPDQKKRLMKLLNDPEYRYLRTASGKY